MKTSAYISDLATKLANFALKFSSGTVVTPIKHIICSAFNQYRLQTATWRKWNQWKLSRWCFSTEIVVNPRTTHMLSIGYLKTITIQSSRRTYGNPSNCNKGLYDAFRPPAISSYTQKRVPNSQRMSLSLGHYLSRNRIIRLIQTICLQHWICVINQPNVKHLVSAKAVPAPTKSIRN